MAEILAEGVGILIAILMFIVLPTFIGIILTWKFRNRGKRVWSTLSAMAVVMYLLGIGIVDLFENDAVRIYVFFAGFGLLITCGIRALIR